VQPTPSRRSDPELNQASRLRFIAISLRHGFSFFGFGLSLRFDFLTTNLLC
jgi:hypothetical protein